MTGQSHSTKAVSGVLSYSLISGINPDCVQAHGCNPAHQRYNQ